MFTGLFGSLLTFGWSSWLWKIVTDLFAQLFGGATP